jgi:hypothetical protein
MDSQDTDEQLTFVNLLKAHPVVLQKSQVPHVKEKKQKAFEEIATAMGGSYTSAQVQKKISNMKGNFKLSSDLTKTGNKKIVLKPWQRLFSKLMDAEKNPTVCCVPGNNCF